MPVYARQPAFSGRLTSSLQPGFDPAAINSAAPSDPMTSFVHRRQFMIEWGHCDPAGIVFNSRFFEFFDWGTWTLFEAALGVKPHELGPTYGIMGIPLVDAGARFLAPARFGDVVELDVAGERVPPFEFRRRASAPGARRARGRGQGNARLGGARRGRSVEDQIAADTRRGYGALCVDVHRV